MGFERSARSVIRDRSSIAQSHLDLIRSRLKGPSGQLVEGWPVYSPSYRSSPRARDPGHGVANDSRVSATRARRASESADGQLGLGVGARDETSSIVVGGRWCVSSTSSGDDSTELETYVRGVARSAACGH